MITNLLKDWTITKRYGEVVFIGKIYNDIKRRFDDGDEIITSRVLKVDFVNGVVETRNSVYHLEVLYEN